MDAALRGTSLSTGAGGARAGQGQAERDPAEVEAPHDSQAHGRGCPCGACAGGYATQGDDGEYADDRPVGDDRDAADSTDGAESQEATQDGADSAAEDEPQGAALSITSRTLKAAPDGTANTRTRVGVGESVRFTGSTAGTWAASGGTPGAGASSTTFTWTAPATAGTHTITLTAGSDTATISMTVVAPSGLSMVNSSSHGLTAGTAGACMLTDVTINPLNVCLGATKWLEVPGPASGVSGYFTQFGAATLYHNPNPSYLGFNDSNTGLNDHAAWHSVPSPYSDGTFRWVIPNKYIIDGEAAGAGRVFTTTTQAFTMNAAGQMTITKAGASVSRSP